MKCLGWGGPTPGVQFGGVRNVCKPKGKEQYDLFIARPGPGSYLVAGKRMLGSTNEVQRNGMGDHINDHSNEVAIGGLRLGVT